MPDLPLLLFPEPDTSSRETLTPGFRKIHIPSHSRQGERTTPLFNNLQQAFSTRNVELTQGATGVDPEQVIVFETVGRIEDFAKAVSRIEGLEWMGEIDIDEIAPDEHFYDERDEEKPLSGRLYLIMSNQRAMEEMLSLWNRIKADETLSFRSGELRGLSKFKEVFKHLKDLRRWGTRDRLIDTGVIEYWKEKLQISPTDPIKFEIELWSRNNSVVRSNSITEVSRIISDLGGRIINQCNIGEIGYNAILAELPPSEIHQIVENQNTELVKSESVMFFRPTGQMMAGESELNEETVGVETEDMPLPSELPIAGILDGLPIANHELLSDRILIDDPDGWETSYQVTDRKHGTAMASLIIQGDLSNGSVPLKSLLYLRLLMKPNLNHRDRLEFVPENVLIVDLIHRAVKRMFDGEGGDPPVAPTVKVINLSIGDTTRLFDQWLSPLARLIDWLSFKYKVLFIVSSGNHADNLVLSMSEEEFLELNNDERERTILKEILGESRNKRLLSPAESINSITVGGLHHDSTEFHLYRGRINPYDSILPSPTNPIGGGFRRSMKPDIVFQSGRQIYSYRIPVNGEPLCLQTVNNRIAPGLQVACPDMSTSSINQTNFTRGSINAAALITRSAIFCDEVLREILDSQVFDDYSEYEACLLKAMVVHGSEWGEVGDTLYSLLNELGDRSVVKRNINKLIGYGIPDIDKSLHCNENRATVLGFGHLKQEQAHIYEFPLPPSLSSVLTKRRLTVTLAYLSPVVSSNMKYRHSKVWFSLENNDLVSSRLISNNIVAKRGTLQHEIFEDEKAVPFGDGDSIRIKVNCMADATKDTDAFIPYGLVVSMETAEGLDVSIYEEVRTRIATAVQIQQNA